MFPKGKNQPQVFCNPEILSPKGVGVTEEGCLSVPGIFDEVKRAATVRARAQDVNGKTFEVDLDGLAAVCLQHEMDHLEGKLFVDYLSDLKRERIRKKLDKDRKERAGKRAKPLPRARTDPARRHTAFGRAHDFVTNRLRGHTAIRAARAAARCSNRGTRSSAC